MASVSASNSFPSTSIKCRCRICADSNMILKISAKSRDINVNEDILLQVALQIYNGIVIDDKSKICSFDGDKFQRYKSPDFPQGPWDSMLLDWLFILNALNFSLWYPKSNKQWTVNNQTGFGALCCALKRAIDEGKPIWSPAYYTRITLTELKVIFRSDDNKTTIPLIRERGTVLHEIGKVLLGKYKGTFRTCVELCEGDKTKLLHLIFNEFESFCDKTYYEAEEVYIGSKARILLSDLVYFNLFSNISRDEYFMPSSFYDYRTPQILLLLGIFSYNSDLVTRLMKNNEPLNHGSEDELHIRCKTITTCTYLFLKLKELFLHNIDKEPSLGKYNIAILIDNYLWSLHDVWNDQWNVNVPCHNIASIHY